MRIIITHANARKGRISLSNHVAEKHSLMVDSVTAAAFHAMNMGFNFVNGVCAYGDKRSAFLEVFSHEIRHSSKGEYTQERCWG